jgi:DmsE family decaheme c-type cytochrome
VKNYSRKTVEFRLTEALSTGVPDKPIFKLHKKFTLLAASALFCWATFGLPQSVKAEGAFTVAGINSTLPAWSQTAQSEQPSQQIAGDSAFSALTSFAQQIGAATPKSVSQGSDSQFDELRSFAQSIGTAQPGSIKDQPKLAAADNLIDWLNQPKGASDNPSSSGPVAGGKRSKPLVEATFVGAKTCLTCHASQTAAFEKTLMGRIGKTQKGKFDCENCHGPGSAHVKAGGGRGVGGIISFRPEDQARTADENNGVCLACHERGDRTYWHGSTHETRGLMCTNCHTVMKNVSRKHQLKTVSELDTCFQCHKDRRAQVARSSHMPLREGKMVCSDCHNPHGSQTEALLKKDSINDTCYTCHAEKRGPFLFEHAPVRENCDNCHAPHGSVNEYMLKISRPRLCTECHAFGHGTNTGPLVVQAISRSCQNCHTEVHGTNSPSGALLHR